MRLAVSAEDLEREPVEVLDDDFDGETVRELVRESDIDRVFDDDAPTVKEAEGESETEDVADMAGVEDGVLVTEGDGDGD